MRIFKLGAFVFRPDCQHVCWDRWPMMAKIVAPTLHQARMVLVQEILNRGLFVREVHVLTNHLAPFNQEVWEIGQ